MMQHFILDFTADLQEIERFYKITISTSRLHRLEECISSKLEQLHLISFDSLDQEGQIDWLLSKNFLNRKLDQTRSQSQQVPELAEFLHPWAANLIELCEWRQRLVKFNGQSAAHIFAEATRSIKKTIEKLTQGKADTSKSGRYVADHASQVIDEIHTGLTEAVGFYRGFDPLLTWWMSQPWEALSRSMIELAKLIREKIVGSDTGGSSDIVGQPLGKEALIKEIEAEFLPYTPEELVKIGEQELEWCERELTKASHQLGYEDPKEALEHVKKTYVEPGEQIHLVHALAKEAVDYIKDRDMTTIPKIANEYWQTYMMPPERQKVAPFFLGGDNILVAYPTDAMSHEDKLMSMRGNNPSFSRSTVFHELVPGHHLQFHYMTRFRPYRKVFETSFWVEGWALYWEMVLWNGGFPAQTSQGYATNEAENRIGMLFWRMHRCARIIFSVKFHLGQMTPDECIRLLVDRVGHERATAEGEVRRSFNGDYSPMYQAGYMLGALQLMRLRQEMVHTDGQEKHFHDSVMKENTMPIELLRALLTNETLSPDRTSRWRFYDFKHE
ncbi:hypothetical protein K461DRAFT_259531 [Myriangium duriaei CBS 260.36]|uniref:X-Pro dipeptidyl-peptidase n=1 Tax=Myriangium duriaei CBS 260.36 TaxID=1168546 RepID=A0A9P4IWE6_9PEZI|nr:hypothetical protein K461DRAFT_259531 [Myriangium duriaei CBS 260.36]